MKKWAFLYIILAAVLIAGCSENSETQAEEEKQKKETVTETEVKQVDDYAISFTDAKTLTAEDEDVIQLTFQLENEKAEKRGFDSLVFQAEDAEGNPLKIAPQNNFGAYVEAGEEVEGHVYFQATEKLPLTVTYDDPDVSDKVSWQIDMEDPS
ncbi:hypothetical protein GLW03_13410 [Halobacillus halophilus]|uniref:DUF4352 domain-containing protein n=1 Tax=Halobacillus halophilus TaxID=1570 RepID=UPI00136F420E|nr:DUF4352 domain-containing protein [Halobacillus halophilus]MYL30809.1 hypothetical protein [Halobacillus halophilus]